MLRKRRAVLLCCVHNHVLSQPNYKGNLFLRMFKQQLHFSRRFRHTPFEPFLDPAVQSERKKALI